MTPEASRLIWLDTTYKLLNDAIRHRDIGALRRAATRVDSARFNEYSPDEQEGMLALYAQGMSACGVMSP